MNFDICANCKKGEWSINYEPLCFCTPFGAYANCFCFKINEKILDELKRVSYHFNGKVEMFMFLEFKSSSETLKKLLKDVEISEACPYYMEHLMSEWNKK